MPLQVVRLHKTYVPSELYSAKDARASLRQKAPAARASLHADQDEGALYIDLHPVGRGGSPTFGASTRRRSLCS